MSTDTPPADSTTPAAPAGGDSTAAILSYIPVIGFIIALILHNGKKTELGAYHLRQSLGLHLTGVAVGVLIVFLGILSLIPFLGLIFGLINFVLIFGGSLAFLVFFILGLIFAAQGQQKPLPLVGDSYQSWFANTFV